ncbi:hypothetical protein HPB50_022959 [Hyalomma asiaticum]|uniref:Uncharacterized protein n=1 Tax=Hyalomma asiaticum TaxID=266040 RepID=A0ACB7S929_HYAAI|nr:hypothetical protein HPB50_022959 [Hyalomma asiaticum]
MQLSGNITTKDNPHKGSRLMALWLQSRDVNLPFRFYCGVALPAAQGLAYHPDADIKECVTRIPGYTKIARSACLVVPSKTTAASPQGAGSWCAARLFMGALWLHRRGRMPRKTIKGEGRGTG